MKSLLLFSMITAVSLPTAAEGHRIGIEQIGRLVGLSGSAAEIRFPEVVSRLDHPQLRVLAQQREGARLRLRVGCVNRGDCLPFYVDLEFASSEAARSFGSQVSIDLHLPVRKPPPVVRQGSVARLEVVAGSRITLRFYVRCLQSGELGEVIGARDEQTHKLYRARVIAKAELRAEP